MQSNFQAAASLPITFRNVTRNVTINAYIITNIIRPW